MSLLVFTEKVDFFFFCHCLLVILSIGVLDLLGVSLLVVTIERRHVALEVLLQLVEVAHRLIKRPTRTNVVEMVKRMFVHALQHQEEISRKTTYSLSMTRHSTPLSSATILADLTSSLKTHVKHKERLKPATPSVVLMRT